MFVVTSGNIDARDKHIIGFPPYQYIVKRNYNFWELYQSMLLLFSPQYAWQSIKYKTNIYVELME